jgi:uncharacterized protein (TIGR03083 family)
MTDRADQTIKALRSGLDDLAALVRGFTAEDLARRSGASQWDVSQVLSHLGSGAEISLAGLEGALNGTEAPAGEYIQGVWARWDAMSRAERAEGFITADEALMRRLEDLGPGLRRDLRIALWWPSEPVDVAGFCGMRLSEFTHHTWDVKAATDPAATLAPDAVDLLVDTAAGLIGFAGKPEGLGRRASVAVRTTAPDRTFGLLIDDTMTLTPDATAPDATLTAPAEWWLRLVAGRHAPEHTPPTVRLTSDTLTLDDLRRAFPGF